MSRPTAKSPRDQLRSVVQQRRLLQNQCGPERDANGPADFRGQRANPYAMRMKARLRRREPGHFAVG